MTSEKIRLAVNDENGNFRILELIALYDDEEDKEYVMMGFEKNGIGIAYLFTKENMKKIHESIGEILKSSYGG